MSKLHLTRYLYFLEEVKITLIDSILRKKSLKECYFWISEIYYSGFKIECIQLLLKIYYYFYHLLNPKLIKKITTFIKISINHDYSIEPLCSIINLLYNNETCPDLFIIRTAPLRGKKNINNIENVLLTHLKKNNCLKVHYYIRQLYDIDFNKCIEILEKFTKTKFVDNIFYDDKLHLLLVFSCKIYNNKKMRTKMASRTKNDEFIKKINKPSIYVYKTLKEKRIFSISTDIGCFKLGTNENNFDKYKSLSNNWEYYSKDTPLWSDRFEKYNVKFNAQNIMFDNDEYLETFYDKYGYEPDEYLLNITTLVKDNTIENWLNSVYNSSYEKIYKDKVDF